MIHILSGLIRSGKTTTLLKWTENQTDIEGVLTPDVAGIKTLYDIKQKKYFEFQIPDGISAESIRIGNFCFSKSSFVQAKNILRKALDDNPAWLVMDEIGPLELNGEGFEPVSREIIKEYILKRKQTNLLLVIRRHLLEQAVQHYGIGEYRIFQF